MGKRKPRFVTSTNMAYVVAVNDDTKHQWPVQAFRGTSAAWAAADEWNTTSKILGSRITYRVVDKRGRDLEDNWRSLHRKKGDRK